MAHTLLAVGRTLLLAYCGYLALLFLLQRSLIFPGARVDHAPLSASPPDGVTPVWLDASFGRVEAWFLESPAPHPAPALMFAHGNGELIDDWPSAMESFTQMGVSTLLVEFPGYGRSEGRPSRGTLQETYVLAYDWLAKQGAVDSDRIILFGRSLGGGVMSDLARARPVGGLIFKSTFSSTAEMAWESFKAPGFLVRDRFDNGRAVSSYKGPILIMHGRTDEVIPFVHAERLASRRPGLEVVPLECGHNDCLTVWPAITDHVRQFLDAHHLRGTTAVRENEL